MEKEYFIAGEIVHRLIEEKRKGSKSFYHGIPNDVNLGKIMTIISQYCSNISFKIKELKYGYKLIIVFDNKNIDNIYIINI